jgi:fructose-bisphosphate aldolase, class I
MVTTTEVTERVTKMFGVDGRIVVLPVDHGLALGMVDGLDDPVEVATDFLKLDGVVDGILSSLPVARRLGRSGMAEKVLRIVTVDSALHGVEGRVRQVRIATMEEAARAEVDAVKVLMAWEEELDSRARTLELVAASVEDAHRNGLPALVEPVATGPVEGLDPAELERRELEGARIAWEIGSDIVKVRVWDTPRFRRFVATCPVPVVALGGSLSGRSGDVIDTVKTAVDIGLRGIFVGRNVWQRPRPEALKLMEEISVVTHR